MNNSLNMIIYNKYWLLALQLLLDTILSLLSSPSSIVQKIKDIINNI